MSPSAKRIRLWAGDQPAAAAAAMVDWSELPSDLVGRIGDCLLASDDFDCYDSMRAVCRGWRSGTADPRTADGFADARFQPKNLAMVGFDLDLIGRLVAMFVNLESGRFLRMRVPALQDYVFYGTTSGRGLFVLTERMEPYETRVLNPYTGSIAGFRVPMFGLFCVKEVAVTPATATSPMMIFIICCDGSFYFADQDCHDFHEVIFDSSPQDYLTSLTPYQGAMYATNREFIVSVAPAVAEEEEGAASESDAAQPDAAEAAAMRMTTTIIHYPQWLTELAAYRGNFLVESSGELLVVTMLAEGQVIHRVDTVNMVLHQLSSLGSRALFITDARCFSVDVAAGEFPTVQADCVYHVERRARFVYQYLHLALADGVVEPVYGGDTMSMVNRSIGEQGPYTLEQVLVHSSLNIGY